MKGPLSFKTYFFSTARILYALFAAILILFPTISASMKTKNISSASQKPTEETLTGGTVSLTFDCSWNDERTEEILKTLSSYQVKATFFVTGEWAEKYPESLLAIYEAGHEIGSHSTSHKRFSHLTFDEKAQELLQSQNSISSIIQAPVLWFRPPYGDTDRETFAAARASGLSCVLWDLDSLDWMNLSPKEISNRLSSACKDGSILLFQNGALNTSSALSYLIPILQAKGFAFTTISELYAKH